MRSFRSAVGPLGAQKPVGALPPVPERVSRESNVVVLVVVALILVALTVFALVSTSGGHPSTCPTATCSLPK